LDLIKQGLSRDGLRIGIDCKNQAKILIYLSTLKEKNHGIEQYIDHWEDTTWHYMVTEYCEKGEVLNFIKLINPASQSSVNEWTSRVRSVFRQMVETVSWMHSHGVAHLDLCLSNILVDSIKEDLIKIKIVDFGSAKRFTKDQRFKGRVGEINTMAPEVYHQKDFLPEKADIWVLGTILFVMLTGLKFPDPNSKNRAAICKNVTRFFQNLKRLSIVPPDALDVMEKIFKPEQERISMEELRRHKYVGSPCNLQSNIQVNQD